MSISIPAERRVCQCMLLELCWGSVRDLHSASLNSTYVEGCAQGSLNCGAEQHRVTDRTRCTILYERSNDHTGRLSIPCVSGERTWNNTSLTRHGILADSVPPENIPFLTAPISRRIVCFRSTHSRSFPWRSWMIFTLSNAYYHFDIRTLLSARRKRSQLRVMINIFCVLP